MSRIATWTIKTNISVYDSGQGKQNGQSHFLLPDNSQEQVDAHNLIIKDRVFLEILRRRMNNKN